MAKKLMIKNAKLKTRSDACCSIFGAPLILRENILPTIGDIIKYYLFVRHERKANAGSSSRESSIAEISDAVASRCELLWTKASISTIGHKRVAGKIRINND